MGESSREPDKSDRPHGDPPPSAGASSAPRPQPKLAAAAAYGAAVLTGLLYFLSFPGMDLWPLSFVALVPLIVALRGQSTRRATALGWAAGFTMTMVGFYWLLDTLQIFSGFPTVLCALLMAVLCAYQGGRIALCGWLYGRAAQRGWPSALVFAGAFAASELLFPLLFPWYYGACVHNAPVLMQTAELGGPIAVGLVLVAANLAVAELAQRLLWKLPVQRRVLVVGLAVPVLAALFGLWRMSAVDKAAQSAKALRVGIVQGNSPLKMAGAPGKDRRNALTVHLERTRELRREEKVDLVVWSEGAVTGFFFQKDYERRIPREVTRHLGVPTIMGTILHERIAEPGPKGRRMRHYNVALLADEKGEIIGRYDKQFLLAFGEYLPFGETFPILYQWSPNSAAFTPGRSLEPLVLGPHRIATTICYEDIIPSFVNKMARQADPDLLVNLTNDTWFGDSTEPWIHLALAKLRTIEQRLYLVRVTNSGVSALVDANGRVLEHTDTFEEQSKAGTVRTLRMTTVYRRLGDIPWWLLAAAMVAASFVRRGKGPARRPRAATS